MDSIIPQDWNEFYAVRWGWQRFTVHTTNQEQEKQTNKNETVRLQASHQYVAPRAVFLAILITFVYELVDTLFSIRPLVSFA